MDMDTHTHTETKKYMEIIQNSTILALKLYGFRDPPLFSETFITFLGNHLQTKGS